MLASEHSVSLLVSVVYCRVSVLGGVRGGVGGGKMGREVGEIRVFDLGGWGENFGQEVGGMGRRRWRASGGRAPVGARELGGNRSGATRTHSRGYEDPRRLQVRDRRVAGSALVCHIA